MKRVLVAVASVLATAQTALAVPVVPNFTQGSMTSTTETTSTVTETINSIDYNTGYTYTVTGTNISRMLDWLPVQYRLNPIVIMV